MNSKSSQRAHFKGLPLVLMLSFSLVLAVGLFWMSRTTTAAANFPDDNLVASTYPNIVGTRIDNCSFCHTNTPNLNPYGEAYKNGGRGSASALTNINNLDSDQDGATNIQEIMALTFPGDASDFPAVPTATKTATATALPPTATRTPTATSAAPNATRTFTVTSVGPTATQAPPTATSVGPTATRLPATATSVGATATKWASPTATRVGPTATKVTKVTKTPGARPTPVVQCVKDDDDDDDDDDKSSADSADGKRRNPCAPGYHPRGSEWERKKGNDDFFKQALQKIITIFQDKKKP